MKPAPRYFNFSKTEYPIHHEPFIFGDVTFDRNDDETLQRIDFNEESHAQGHHRP